MTGDDSLFYILKAAVIGMVIGWFVFRRQQQGGQKPPPPSSGAQPKPPPQPFILLPPPGSASPPKPPPKVSTLSRPLVQPPPPVSRPGEPRIVHQTLNLTLAQFAPISADDAKRQARAAGNMLASPWFGRRDLIPPADDPRTGLIDRGMVAQGLITPEELLEIHRVGQEMDRLRPRMATVQQAGQAAVAADQEERKRLKERKKAEAAERKRLHAEAVARRRQTDIVFLGCGVSRGLADRRANVEKLQAAGLPVLDTPASVAQALGITIPRLRWLAYHADAATVTHYIQFTIPKRSGGLRTLSAPHEDMAAAQEWIFQNILSKIPTHDAAHGFVAGRSTVTNAALHVGRAVVLNTDLKDFFPSITVARVRGVFRELGYSPAAASILALLCTESPRRAVTYAGKTFHVATAPRALPQGACTSPALSNLASRRMDSRLAGIARKLGWAYTRYADDLTFSAPPAAGDGPQPAQKVGYLLARIRHIAQDEGFAVNEKKTRVQKPAMAQTVTGVIVNTRPGVPRDIVRNLRAILHRAKTEGLAAQNRRNLPHFEAWLKGMLAYIHMVNPAQANPLRQAFDALHV